MYQLKWVLKALVLVVSSLSLAASAQEQSTSTKIVVDADGTIEAPARSVPPSSLLSEEGKAYLSQHLHDMQVPAKLKSDDGVPVFMKRMLERAITLYPVTRKDERIAGVHVYSYMPRDGVTPRNRRRVLINLHGGGFSGCWPGCAELESIPIAALMRAQVITVDYREGPANKFPAASEDVALIYRELLKTHKPQNIGIYGCSAGGMLTAMSLSWFQAHGLPTPGAAGIYCAGAGGSGGDAAYIAFPLGEARIPSAGATAGSIGYLNGTDPKDPLVAPIASSTVLAKFPPTLIITATRDFALSGALHTDVQLTKAGVHTELHVWDGMFHGFFYNPDTPESKEAFGIMVKFFDTYLGVR